MQPGYLGQLVAAPFQETYLSKYQAQEIKNEMRGEIKGRRIEVLVTSGNKLKIAAAKESVVAWIQTLFNETIQDVFVKGYAVSSETDEQPHSQEQTLRGAKNRLRNLRFEILKEEIGHPSKDGLLRVLVSLENGIMVEPIKQVKNSTMFLTDSKCVWVDRCIVVGEIQFQDKEWNFSAISEGVTNPKAEVEESKKTNWEQTVGSFLSKKHGWPAADFHDHLAGKGRKELMENAVKAGLGLKV